MKNYIEFELGRSPGGIGSTWLGDWNTPETSPPGDNPPEDSRVPATAFLYRMFVVMHDIALALGHTNDATEFAAKAATVKRAFNAAFFNASAGHYAGVGDSGYRQSHNVLAVAFNLTQDAHTAQAVADTIAADVANRGMHLNTGALSTKYLLPVLSAYGHLDTAFAVAQQTTFPSWGFWMNSGATTTWEHWLADARSHDHFFLGTFDDWFFKSVLGIQSTSVAFQTVDIAPVFTNNLESASGWMLTPFGNLSVAWSRDAGSLSLKVGVPVGVVATISFSGGRFTRVSEGAVEVQNKEGVIVHSPMRVSVGSGAYSFLAM